MPAIQGVELTPEDIGRTVVYTPPHGGPGHQGVLSSYRADTSDEKTGKVRLGAVYVRFRGPQGEMCQPSSLSWLWSPKRKNRIGVP